MFIIMIIAALGWLAVGLPVARHVHTRHYREWLDSPRTRPVRQLSKRAWSHRFPDAVEHVSHCNRDYRSLWSEGGCSCDKGTKAWRDYLANEEPVPPPEVTLWPVLLWPIHLMDAFVMGGARRLPDPVRIAEVEAELDRQIKELP